MSAPKQDDMNTQIDDKQAKILELQDALKLSREGKCLMHCTHGSAGRQLCSLQL